MTTVVLSPTGTASFPEGGGHWWVYLQYAFALRDLGVRVVWVERCTAPASVPAALRLLCRLGFDRDDVLIYRDPGPQPGDLDQLEWLVGDPSLAARLLSGSDLLLDFDYASPSVVVEAARRSAMVDIDPGLFQYWWSSGQITPAAHDRWFTTGETVGVDTTRIPDCGVAWQHIRPPVHLPSWPVVDVEPGPFTTVTSWWGDEWLVDDDGLVIENNKRVGFLPYADLPRLSRVDLELAACFGTTTPSDGRVEDVSPGSVGGDAADVAALQRGGWRLRRSSRVCRDPFRYREYIQGSRGEFSCVKPSCRRFANAWISDRTLCYLASGRPVVVEDTGPSGVLDVDAGLLRFSSMAEAAAKLAAVQDHYGRHQRAARELAEAYFSADEIVAGILEIACHEATRT